jgi:DNA helicase-2/ATP-dependent DNA helicase PcrA
LEFPHVLWWNGRRFVSECNEYEYKKWTRGRASFVLCGFDACEHQAYLTDAQSRYRWANWLIANLPDLLRKLTQVFRIFNASRVHYRFNQWLIVIFWDVDKSNCRQNRPTERRRPNIVRIMNLKLRSIFVKPVSSNAPSGSANLFDNKLVAGNVVMHERFEKAKF